MLLSALYFAPSQAQDIASAWKEMPLSIHPTIDNTARLDMIDLYQAGMTAQAATLINDTARLEYLGNTYLRLRTSQAGYLQIKLLNNGNKRIYAVVTTIEGPVANSHIDLYDDRWQPITLKKHFTAPCLDDFITLPAKEKERRQQLHKAILLHTYLYTMNDEDNNITITPTFLHTIDEENRPSISTSIAPHIIMQWKGGKWHKKRQ